ncbi:MAG TPA: hypothetical protein VFA83_09860 [Acidimicrobiales bacterium]|nr:hypothetical protein [Acidimicrobiales bacterium]
MLPNTRTVTNVLAAAALALTACGGGGAPPVEAPPHSVAGFRIVYRVETHAQAEEVTRREVTVRRPDDSSDLTYPDGSTQPASGFVSHGTRLYSVDGGALVDHGDRSSGAPPGDWRLAPALPDLARLALVRRVGTARVAGRPCVVYRFAGPVGDPIARAHAGEYADECVDGRGLLLSERWVLDGRVLRLTEATQVDTAGPADAAFVPPALPGHAIPIGFTAVETLSPTKLPSTGQPYWVAPAPPWGFRLARRVRAVTSGQSPDGPQISDVAYVDTYVRGSDAITVVHRDRTLARAPNGAERVHAGRLGTAQVTFSSAGASLAFTAGKWVVTVEGPFDIAHLRVFASDLEPR